MEGLLSPWHEHCPNKRLESRGPNGDISYSTDLASVPCICNYQVCIQLPRFNQKVEKKIRWKKELEQKSPVCFVPNLKSSANSANQGDANWAAFQVASRCMLRNCGRCHNMITPQGRVQLPSMRTSTNLDCMHVASTHLEIGSSDRGCTTFFFPVRIWIFSSCSHSRFEGTVHLRPWHMWVCILEWQRNADSPRYFHT